MSRRPEHFSEHSRHQGHEHGRSAARAAPPPYRSPPAAGEDGYTLAHAGKRVRVGPVVFWIVVGSIVIMGAWSAATATYFTFRDDVLTRLVARQAEMQYAYEDRIAELRAQIDRTTSRQLLDQEQFEQKLDQIQRRQVTLEQRTTALGTLPDTAPTGSVRSPGRGAALADPITTGSLRPSAVSDTVVFIAPPDREARLESRSTAFASLLKPGELAKTAGLGNVLTRMQLSLDGVEGRQMVALNSLEESFELRMRRMRGLFSDLGLDLAGMETTAPSQSGVGGPFVPARPANNAGPFERQLYRINLTRAQIDRLNRTLAVVPYRKPVIGQVEFSSGFGVRSDPFLGRPAMHTGLDFRASPAIQFAPQPTARSSSRDGKAATARWSRSIMATRSRRATATSPKSTSRSATSSASAR